MKTAADTVTPRPASDVNPTLSIATQLIVHHLLSAFLIMTLCMGGLYWGIARSLKTHAVAYMRDEIALLVPMITSGDLEWVSRKIVSSGQKEFAKLFIRIVDEQGMPIIETPSMGHLIPVKDFHQPVPHQSLPLHEFEKKQIGKNFYLVESFMAPGRSGDRHIQMALDVTNQEHVLQDYLFKVILVLVGGVALSGLAGSYITHRGLRPLATIAGKTRQITASRLGERFSSERWPLELVSLADALDSMLDRLQESFERMRSYAANLAHEIRTPIGILRGEAEVTLSKRRSSEEYERIIESSLEEYQRLSKIVESLLFLAMADSREVELNVEQVRVYDEIHNLQDYYDEHTGGKSLVVLCDPELVMWADATLFRRAVSNLISNALKYGTDGVIVTVDAAKTGESVVISVSDTGSGIESEYLERLFDRFYRVPAKSISKVKGFGLGLSIVYSIMKLHGGTVSIDSTVGKGTRVTLSFPGK